MSTIDGMSFEEFHQLVAEWADDERLAIRDAWGELPDAERGQK